MREETAQACGVQDLEDDMCGHSLTTLGKRIAGRSVIVSAVDVPRNGGKRRMPSRQALLDEIAKAGGQW
ncbi:MAG: hypothetical protein KGJ57_12560 [Sphingomonadales bacterium]|nr:hypothetical protein [Sphingomonadales bacterium]MDE2170247.1 hypothetical protein [Sphingomonadales bacterium]